jgi:hypothetical protein
VKAQPRYEGNEMKKVVFVDPQKLTDKINNVISWTPAQLGEYVEIVDAVFFGAFATGKVSRAVPHPKWNGWYIYDVTVQA